MSYYKISIEFISYFPNNQLDIQKYNIKSGFKNYQAKNQLVITLGI